MVSFFLASFFIFDEYYEFLAAKKFNNMKTPQEKQEAKQEIMNRLSTQGMIELHDRAEELQLSADIIRQKILESQDNHKATVE